jgi:disulfide bond formation protein DsbB
MGLYWQRARIIAAVLFVISMISLLTGTMHYIREVSLALSSVREESADSRFMDLNDSAFAAENGTVPPVRHL